MTSKEVFERFVPASAVEYCNNLYAQLGFEFKVKKSRATKLGDFRYNYETKQSTITINNDLNPFAFLVTYLHEVAHHLVRKEFGRSVKPHGSEWKNCFANISKPVLNDETFPPEVLASLKKYFKNPKASSCSDPTLFKSLRLFDQTDSKMLNELTDSIFVFKGKTYRKIEKRRTRWLCEELASKKRYLISGIAPVEPVKSE